MLSSTSMRAKRKKQNMLKTTEFTTTDSYSTVEEEKKSAFCMGMSNHAACVVMGCIYALAPLMYVLYYNSIPSAGWICKPIWVTITIHAGVFFYASFLCFMSTCSPSAVYCKQLDTIQHYVWKTLAIFAAICFLLSAFQFVVYFRGNGYHDEKKQQAKWFNLESIFDAKFDLIDQKLQTSNKPLAVSEFKKGLSWLRKKEYTAAATLLIFAVISSLCAALIAFIESQFAEMAARIYKENKKDFKRAEMFAEKMRKPEAPKCCCIFGNTATSFLMTLLYLLPLFACWYSYKSTVIQGIIEVFNKSYYLGYVFQGLAFIQVVVFLYAAVLCLINACNPSMWCCKQVQTLSTYLLILVSIFTCIFFMLTIHQIYDFTKNGDINVIRENIKDLQIEGVKKYWEYYLEVQKDWYQIKESTPEFDDLKAEVDTSEQKSINEIKENENAARNFFGIIGIAGVIFIIGLRYMESQFQAMSVYLYGFDIYQANKKMKDAGKKEKAASI